MISKLLALFSHPRVWENSGKKLSLLWFTTAITIMCYGQTITTGTVSGPFCAGSVVNIPYTFTGGVLNVGNVFTAELSDASGSFTSPVTIGTFTSILPIWTVSATIPATITQGTGYRVRVRSSSPAVIGSPNGTDITLYEIYTGNQIFLETCGTIAGNTAVATHETANGFDNDGFTMSKTGSCDLSIGNSTNYTGASGNASVRFTGAGTFLISGINTSSYGQMGLGFGIMKNSAAADGSNISVAVSTDGITFTNLSFAALPTGGGTNNTWYYRVTSGTIPSTSNLRIRFSCTGGTTMNLDDFELGNAVTPVTVQITPNTNQNLCNSTSLTISATNYASANYYWSNSATTSSITTSASGNYSVSVNDLFGCAVTRGPISVNFNATLTPSVSISSNVGNTICSGSSVTFTAAPTNGGSSPSYQWKVNGSNVGNNSSTFTTSSLTNGQVVTCVMTSNLGCASPTTATSGGQTMIVNPRPTAIVSGGGIICPGGSSAISIALTGTGPWSGTLSNGTSFSGSISPLVVSLSPSIPTTYTVSSLSDVNCSSIASDLTGSATISISNRPTAVISGGGSICAGGSSTVSIALTGTGPWSGTLSNGTAFSGSTSPIVLTLTPGSTTTYTVATLSDANCTSVAADLSGSATITINPAPSVAITSTSAVCPGSAGIVTFTGAPWTSVTYNINGVQEEGILIMGSGTASVGTGPLNSATTYNLVNADDGVCMASVVGSTTIAMSNPTATITGSVAICPGSSSDIHFNGTPNAVVQFNVEGEQDYITLDASGHAVLNTGSVYASSLDYNLMSVTEGTCSAPATGTATISTTTMPEAIISGGTQLCFGGATLIEFTGTPNSVVDYRINGGADHTISLDASGYASVGTGALSATTTYSIMSVSIGACTQSIVSDAVVEIISNTYYQDLDNDGFGNGLVSLTACTQPAGYVENTTDCDDTNSDLNPNTVWYADMDGDGFGSYIYMTQCDNPGLSGVILQGGDCDDTNPLILDDCSGIPNDNWVNASPVTGSLNAYPACTLINGTCLNASISPQGNSSNVAAGGGRDVWYKFTSPSTAVRIRVIPTGFDAVIELQNSTEVEIDVENADPTVGGDEIMNIGGLNRGEQYWIGVRNYQNSDGGDFTICISPLMDTRCDDGPGTYPLCTNFKPDYTGAVNYTFHFDPTGSTPGFSSAGIHSSQIPLNTPLDLRYDGTYDVMIDANYTNLTDGVGNPEPITVPAIDVCPIVISAQPDLQIKETQRCPAYLLHATRLAAKPFICGPVIQYEYEFTEIDCDTQIAAGLPFTKTTTTASPNLPLNFSAPMLLPGACYSVRVRPVFTYGAGSYGTAHCIHMSNVASGYGDSGDSEGEIIYLDNPMEANIYPNPNGGEKLTITLTEVKGESAMIRILDAMGRLIYTREYQIDGQLLTTISLQDKVTKGLYFVEFIADGKTLTRRLIIQ